MSSLRASNHCKCVYAWRYVLWTSPSTPHRGDFCRDGTVWIGLHRMQRERESSNMYEMMPEQKGFYRLFFLSYAGVSITNDCFVRGCLCHHPVASPSLLHHSTCPLLHVLLYYVVTTRTCKCSDYLITSEGHRQPVGHGRWRNPQLLANLSELYPPQVCTMISVNVLTPAKSAPLEVDPEKPEIWLFWAIRWLHSDMLWWISYLLEGAINAEIT